MNPDPVVPGLEQKVAEALNRWTFAHYEKQVFSDIPDAAREINQIYQEHYVGEGFAERIEAAASYHEVDALLDEAERLRGGLDRVRRVCRQSRAAARQARARVEAAERRVQALGEIVQQVASELQAMAYRPFGPNDFLKLAGLAERLRAALKEPSDALSDKRGR